MEALILDWTRTLYDKETDELFPGAMEFLQKVSERYTLGLITSHDGSAEEREKQIRGKHVWEYFEEIFIVDKKHVDQFTRMCDLLNTSPEDVLVIGDKARAELSIGHMIGCKTCWVLTGKKTPPVFDPTYVVDDLQELQELLSRAS